MLDTARIESLRYGVAQAKEHLENAVEALAGAAQELIEERQKLWERELAVAARERDTEAWR